MISFPSSSSLIQIENAYSNLQGDIARQIRLPTHLNQGGTFGITAALIQFVATWARSNPDGILLPYSSSSGIASFSEFLRQPHGLVASYMVPHLADPKHVKLNKPDVLAQAADLIEAMQLGRLRETMNGRGALLVCFAGARNEFLLPLYERQNIEGMRGTGGFEDLTQKIIGACAPKMLRHTPETTLQMTSLLLRELFENTNDHASTDELGRTYNWEHPNVRGILAKYISFAPSEKNAVSAFDDIPHRLFFQKALLNYTASKTIDFLELSVFDSGPGIARKWLAHIRPQDHIEQLSIGEEESLVREAFELGKTSKKVGGTGVGLDSVIKSMVRLKALLRLRTGRLCLYQDFSSGSATKFEPRHWLSDRCELPNTVGTSFSILIPLSSRASV